MAADACDKMLYLAKAVDSDATSTSMIRLFAASRFAEVSRRWSSANCSRVIVAPFSALRVAMFSSALVKKLIPNAPMLNMFDALARVILLPPVAPAAVVAEPAAVPLKVRAAKSVAL